jgi:NADPH-dependent curcumin reductase CurA
VRLNYLWLDPTCLVWMTRDSSIPAVALDDAMRGIVCASVLDSHGAGLPAGSTVIGLGVWADCQLATPGTLRVMADTGPVPVAEAFGTSAALAATASVGMLDIGQPYAGETVVVSGAAGAIGGIAGRIAKLDGGRAVGLAGTDDKCGQDHR